MSHIDSIRSELESAVTEAVQAFRTGQVGAGSAAFVKVVDGLMALLALPGAHSPESVAAIGALVGELAQAQVRRDHLCLADLLQYELGPLLSGC